ncbi:MAG: histidine kinase [Betaproteobacteria bacterium]|nr:histidine kinase [Betaproteobacteria bacterium]
MSALSVQNLVQSIRAAYASLETRQLAKLSEHERAEVLAFDALLRRRAGAAWGTFLLIWAVGAAALWSLHPRLTVLESALLSLTFVLATGFGLASIWFGHGRYKGPLYRAALIMLVLPVLGALVGGFIAQIVKQPGATPTWALTHQFLAQSGPKVLVAGLVVGLVYAVFMVSVIRYRRHQLLEKNAELEARAREERLVRSLTDAKLKLMQAQVEPHFLFNTLSSVKQLAERGAPEAAQLTGNLITFLRAGMSGLRGDQATLGAEVDMAAAYLAIMKTRMGARLSSIIDVPENLRTFRMPPAMLISLVENAIKHGIEPSPKGGEVRVTVRVAGEGIDIIVADTGRGMSDIPGGGVGLANIRERLAALFVDRAALTLAENDPHGFVARMHLPPLAN